MGQGQEQVPELTVGLDLGDRYCEICALDREGEVMEQGKGQTQELALRRRFGGLALARIVIEVGTHSPWIGRVGGARAQDISGVYPDGGGPGSIQAESGGRTLPRTRAPSG